MPARRGEEHRVLDAGPDEPALVQAADAAPSPDEGFLENVLGVVPRAKHPVAVRQQLLTVWADQPLGRGRVPRPGGVEDLGRCVHTGHPGQPR